MKKCFAMLLCLCLLLGAAPFAASAEDSSPESPRRFGTTISAGEWHMAAIKEDGSLWAWGYNDNNRLGDGTTESSSVPVKALDDAVSVDAAWNKTSAIRSDGSLWNWGGRDKFGELGRAATGKDLGPGKVMDGVKDVSAGAFHVAAVKTDGTLWLWGQNSFGQLGNGGTGTYFENDYMHFNYEPLPVLALTGIVSVEVGDSTSMAIDAEGGLWAWGECTDGKLGPDVKGNALNESINHYTPWEPIQTVPVKIMEDVAQVSTDLFSVALKTDGTVVIWGHNHRAGFVRMPLENIVSVDTNGTSFAAIDAEGGLWIWGYGLDHNDKGQNKIPEKVMDDVVSVAVGGEFYAALKSDGSLWTWGRNQYGQLGDGTNENRDVPTKVMDGVAIPSALPNTAAFSTDGGLAEDIDYAAFYNGNAYIMYQGALTWEQANEECRRMGGHLATATSAGEQEFLRKLAGNNLFWIGAKADAARNWNWVTGEAWYWTDWAPGEPTDTNGNEDYAAVFWNGWMDLANDNTFNAKGFICEWDAGGSPVLNSNVCTIYFDANGGVTGTASKTATYGGYYGVLPTATRNGCTFTGWFTAPEGGSLVMETSYVMTTGMQTLYAHWASAGAAADVPTLSYQFGNNAADFGYPDPYRISYERYAYIYGDNDAAKSMFNSSSTWGGSCYGMSATAMILNQGSILGPSSFKSGSSVPSQLALSDVSSALGLDLIGFIESVQVSQYAQTLQNDRDKNKNQYFDLVQAVLRCSLEGGDPVIISIKGPRGSDGKRPGHAVVGYAAYRVPEASKDIIMIYDPNFPGDSTRCIDLYYNSAGQYTGWYYKLNDKLDWGTAYDSGYITFSPLSSLTAVWNNRGKQSVLNSDVLSINSMNASLYDYSGNLMAKIVDGEVVTDRTDIFTVERFEGEAEPSDTLTLWVPAEHLLIVNEDETVTDFAVTLASVANSVSVTTTAGGVLCYASADTDSGLVFLNDRNESYEITLGSGSDAPVSFSGKSSESFSTCIARKGGRLMASGVEVGTDARLTIDGQTAGAENVEQSTVVSMISSDSPDVVASVFTDVPGDSYYTYAAQWACEKGITKGTAKGYFSPDAGSTRAQAVTMLWRAAGMPAAETGACPFTDVPADSYYYDAVCWAYHSGVTVGTDETHFSPDAVCTYSHILAFLWNMLGKPGLGTPYASYADANEWAAVTGLIKDTAALDSLAMPCPRCDLVTFLYRALR